jgi:hypothetical protein
MIRKRRIQTITWLLVWAHLFGWSSGALALSVVSAAMHDSHAMFLAYEHGEVHLILRHSGHHNGDSRAIGDIQAYVIPTGKDQHPDHEIHLSDHEHPLTPATKTLGNLENLASTQIAWLSAEQVQKLFPTRVPGHPPDADPHLQSLRTVVLLI